MELTKADKRAAREIIATGLQNEFKQGLLNAGSIVKEWERTGGDNKAYYHKLYTAVKDFDKHIAHRYDAMRGSDYLFIIAAQLNEGVVSEDDLTELSEDARKAIAIIRK